MTRHELHEILKIPFCERQAQGLQTFEWEHCAKSFSKIPNNLAIKHLMQMSEDICKENDDPIILRCESNSETYYFGVGLKDCDNISLKKERELYCHGTWYVYTWSN